MKKVVGYVVSIAGLVVMALGLGTFKLDWAIFDTVSQSFIIGAGVIGIIVGIVISLTDKGIKQGKQVHEEVPIYEGQGKNRKIVGYQRK
jgi:tellurite resistance protein TehA-like permease